MAMKIVRKLVWMFIILDFEFLREHISFSALGDQTKT